jgi:carboxyl-terminal processing protease
MTRMKGAGSCRKNHYPFMNLRGFLSITSGALVLVVSVAAAQSVAAWRAEGLASFDDVWQTIADTFYDPAFGGVDWAAARAELRPRVESAASPDDIRRVIEGLIARLKRSHFLLLSAAATDPADGPIGPATVPIDVRVTGEGAIVTRVEPQSSADRAGIVGGQVLVSIDGAAVAPPAPGGRGAQARLDAFAAWRRVNHALHGERGSTAAIVVQPPSGPSREIAVPRVTESGDMVTFGNLPPLAVRTDAREMVSPRGRHVGYVQFNFWMTAIDAPVAAAIDRFRRADGLILDLRGNPGGLAAMMSGIAGHLMTDPDALLGRMQTRQMQLEFHPNPRLSTPDGRRVSPYAGPVAILVDELTGSTSECFTGALQSLGRARVFGRQTLGEALPALTKRLPNGDVLMYAVGNFVTSTGRALEGDGVTPDEFVPLARTALAEGRDETAEAALRWFDALGKRPQVSVK